MKTQQPDNKAAERLSVPPISTNPFKDKNYPNMVAPNESIPVFGLGSIVLVKSPDGHSYNAWSDDVDQDSTGGWQRLEVPDGLKLTPIGSTETLAFVYEGKTIEEVAAFSAETVSGDG